MSTYTINSTGNRINAEQYFMDAHYPGNYTLVIPTPPSTYLAPSASDVSAIAGLSYQASLQRQAQAFQAKGKTIQALQLLLKGIKS